MAYTFVWEQKEKDALKLDESGAPVYENGKPVTYKRPPIFKGKVVVEVPKHQERLKFLKSLQLSVSADGEVKSGGIDSTDMTLEFVKKHIKEVSLVRESDGFVFDNLEILDYDQDCLEVMTDIGNMMIQGIRLGKT